MVNKFTPVFLFFGMALLWVATTSNSSNPPNGRTGAPGDGICSNCHFGGGGFDGSVSITGLPAVVDPNTTYPVTITVSNPNGAAQRAGFQWVALNSANQNVGSITSAGPGSTITPSGGRIYHEHNPAQFFGTETDVSWTANWTSPDAPSSDDVLTFYTAAVIGNGSGSSGDLVVTNQVSVQIMDIPPLSASITNPVDASCNGGNDGQATAVASDGTPPYSYNWSSGSTDETATNLAAGTNTVTITDANQVEVVLSVEIVEPELLEVELVGQSSITCADPDGSLSVEGVGGTPAYNYLWSNGVEGPVNESAAAGSTVTVTDANGCQASMTYTLTENTLLPSIEFAPDNPQAINCNMPEVVLNAELFDCDNCAVQWTTADGNIVMTNSPTSITISAGGTYTIAATNLDNGCSTAESIQIEEAPELDAAVAVFDVLCAGEMTGSAEVILNGGTPPYTFTLVPEGDIGGLSAGVYTLTAEDIGGCVDTVVFEVDEPAPIVIDVEVTQPENGNNNGAITFLDVSGGVIPYDFSWLYNGAPFSDEADITDLAPGEYTLIILDENDCELQETFILDNINAVASVEPTYELAFFPNPVSDWLTIEMDGNSAMEMNVGLYSLAGQLVYSQAYPKATQRQERIDISVYPSGVYWLRIQLDGQIEVHKVVIE
jgi:hypothetical protein